MQPRSSAGSNLLKRRLAELDWSQTRLAAELYVSMSAVSRWLSGSRAPGRVLAARIEQLVGVPVSAWDDEPRNEAVPQTG